MRRKLVTEPCLLFSENSTIGLELWWLWKTVSMNVLERPYRVDRRSTPDSDQREEDAETRENEADTKLFSCPHCSGTFINRPMTTNPRCDRAV